MSLASKGQGTRRGRFRAWTKLWLVYNLVLLVEGLWIMRKCLSYVLTHAPTLGCIIVFGVLANAFYCLAQRLRTSPIG